ncbi:MAG: bifunctional pyr operon transcriptional regulator/uracil phosphoribosyltransferase PyrR [Akkermansiaceae bacterium]|nr:bifunctional pyr operon transcriptional regulator/uracil phosphoribosyltransferase PyrR [Akkermansiaceae bacterium]NNM30080.1 bifunctional pyr operon transcriptional regulator/uracil phosphoribosyltransferase PyrR [Akkermansiaceae bacterium]
MPIVLDEAQIAEAVASLAAQIKDAARGERIAIVGIRRRGDEVADRVCRLLREMGVDHVYGMLDISLYRDDLAHLAESPRLQGSEISFPVEGARIVIVDDVLFTGRTIRAALDALWDYGRPAKTELAVLIDRGHRELPIRPDFTGVNLKTARMDHVLVRLKITDGEDAVELVESS